MQTVARRHTMKRSGGAVLTPEAYVQTKYEMGGRPPRELASLITNLGRWIFSRVYATPMPAFVKALVDAGYLKLGASGEATATVDEFVRTTLNAVIRGDAATNGLAGVVDPNEGRRDEQYARLLNFSFGFDGPFDLTTLVGQAVPTASPPFTPVSVRALIKRGVCQMTPTSQVIISQQELPLFVRPAFGGSDVAKAGGQAMETTTSTQYVPTVPRVSSVQSSSAPCMYERKVQKGDGYWYWQCVRTSEPGIRKCSLVRVEDKRQTLVPIQCLQEYVNVLKGFQVDKTTRVDEKGNTTVQQTITPEVQVYGTVTAQGPAGRPIPYEDLPPYASSYDEGTNDLKRPPGDERSVMVQPFGMMGAGGPVANRNWGGGGGGNKDAPQRTAGSTAAIAKPKKKGGAASPQPLAAGAKAQQPLAKAQQPSKSKEPLAGGASVQLPSRTAVRNKQFKLTTADIENITTGVPPDMIVKPESWQNITPAIGPEEIAFYTYEDSYGMTSTRRLQNGFNFTFKYLPFAYMTNQSYLEWLVSLDYKMRAEFPDDHHHVYDPLLDTIATVETYIMTTIARLEAKGQYFNRAELFEGAGPHREVMHRYLRVYAFTPPQNTWYSPLSGRYIELPAVGGNVPEDERATLEALQNLNDSIARVVINGEAAAASGIPGGFRIPLKYRALTPSDPGAPAIRPNAVNPLAGGNSSQDARAAGGLVNEADRNVVGIAEDELMSMLARLQYIHGFAINTKSNDNGIAIGVEALLRPGRRRFLQRETVRYLEMFQLEGASAPTLHRLPGLRMREAAERGLSLPRSAMAAYGRDWNLATRAALPGMRAGIPPSVIETRLMPPRSR